MRFVLTFLAAVVLAGVLVPDALDDLAALGADLQELLEPVALDIAALARDLADLARAVLADLV